eukprot:1650418-Amphidinium_carterae.1
MSGAGAARFEEGAHTPWPHCLDRETWGGRNPQLIGSDPVLNHSWTIGEEEPGGREHGGCEVEGQVSVAKLHGYGFVVPTLQFPKPRETKSIAHGADKASTSLYEFLWYGLGYNSWFEVYW